MKIRELTYIVVLTISLTSCTSKNIELSGNWICTNSISTDSTDHNRYYKGYIVGFSDSNIFNELTDSNDINGELFSINNHRIYIQNEAFYEILKYHKDSLELLDLKSHVELKLTKAQVTNFQNSDSILIDSILTENTWNENYNDFLITYYFDSIPYLPRQKHIKISDRIIENDTSYFAQGYWWGLENYNGLLLIHHSDDGFNSSIFQVENYNSNRIQGYKLEECNDTQIWDRFTFNKFEVSLSDLKRHTESLIGIWNLKEVKKPNIARINKTIESGFIDGGGSTIHSLRFNLLNLKEVDLSIELNNDFAYKIIGNKKLNKKGKWSLTKDGRLICFDNQDINNNCFLFQIDDNNDLVLKKYEDIEIEYGKRNFTTEETELILSR